MKACLKKDIEVFLDKYHKFKEVNINDVDKIIITGMIDIVDSKSSYWDSYKIAIIINKNSYPYTIPTVMEVSEKIERDWDFHISTKGSCCLNIPHELIKLRKRGIILSDFYSDVVYPFFANHQYKLSKGEYVNGEYKHFDEGIIQFYNEEYNLTDEGIIYAYLNLALGNSKAEPNRKCPVCGGRKYKKCCRPIVNKLKGHGNNRLDSDLKIFAKRMLALQKK